MANDIYTRVSLESDDFTKFVGELEKDSEPDKTLISTMYPNETDTESWDWYSNNVGAKWCYVDQLDDNSIEFHSAWSSPVGLIVKLADRFGIKEMSVQSEDVDWGCISRNPNLTMEIIEKYPDKPWNWTCISRHPNITMEMIEKYPNKPWKWFYISSKTFKKDYEKELQILKKNN